MNIDRGSLVEFHYASAGNVGGEYIVPPVSSANNTTRRVYRITDLKATCSTTGTIKILGRGSNDRTLEFKIPVNGVLDMSWEMPYRISVLASTGQIRGLRASTSQTGVRYAISGFIEV